MNTAGNKKFSESELVKIFTVAVVLAVIILVPLKIAGYGYLPPDDALRHAGKAISGKGWNEILVLRPDILMDSHPGWHATLAAFCKFLSFDADTLVSFSVISLFILFAIIPPLIMKRPEAWLMSLFFINAMHPSLVTRLLLGRPYIFTMAIVLVICLLWRKLRDEPRPFIKGRGEKTPFGLISLFVLLIAFSTWIHGSWHLFLLLLLSFFIAREWRVAFRLGVAIAIGVIIGALFTGHPYLFLKQMFLHSVRAFSNNALQRMLVGEFQPFEGDGLMVLVVLIMLGWRKMRGAWDRKAVDNPVFILASLGWVLGFISRRFWLDWGMPALSVWVAREFEDFLEEKLPFFSWNRLLLTLVFAFSFYVSLTGDVRSRWTGNLTTEYLSTEDAEHREWLPGPSGIIYSDDMTIFYDTFFRNPLGEWRYILGFEPTMMPEEDLRIFRKIQWNFGADESFEPWVKKMRTEDRLILRRGKSTPPDIKELEWHYAATGIWVGRLKYKK